MGNLNEQFLSVYAEDGVMRWETHHGIDPRVETEVGPLQISFNPYDEPSIEVGGLGISLTKGQIALDNSGVRFEPGGISEKGLVLETDESDPFGHRRFVIEDEAETVWVSTWTKYSNGPDEDGFNGGFGLYSAVAPETTNFIKDFVGKIIEAAEKTVKCQPVT